MYESIQMPRAKPQPVRERRFGIAYWMERVLSECDMASRSFDPDHVHDLRVALRRCRSLAEGVRFVDPDPAWEKMRRCGKELFGSLGALRDAQVMMEWVTRIGPPDDPPRVALENFIAGEEERLKKLAADALHKFDRQQWEGWIEHLAIRVNRLRLDSLIFRHLALERWMEGYELHRQALRNRTHTSYHQLRIGIKRFRYTVENFLPVLHEQWEEDLKQLQDALGEVHDLDLLWATALRRQVFADVQTRQRWHIVIEAERNQRLDAYRARMLGAASLWRTWRAALPKSTATGALARLKTWSTALNPDPPHARHVARLSVGLYDSLRANDLLALRFKNGRAILWAAGLLHDIGFSKAARKVHKKSAGLIRKLKAPAGWSADDIATTALVVRYHRGKFPGQEDLKQLSREQREFVIAASGILRLADALDSGANHAAYKLQLSNRDTYVAITVPGASDRSRFLEKIARARYPLEALLNRPLFIRPDGLRSSVVRATRPHQGP